MSLKAKLVSLKVQLQELIVNEEIFWRQKPRATWIKQGDVNTKFFHNMANGRKNRKTIEKK